MRKWLIVVSALLATSASGAPAWTWVDANGQVHFSDRPVPGARQVELAGAQSFNAPLRQPAAAGGSQSGAPASGTPYRAIEIVAPGNQETLWNIGGVLTVQVRLDPGLQAGHRVDLALDGQRRNLNTASLQFTLNDVFRGAHTLQALVIDSTGTELMRSAPSSFVVQQTSVQNPNSLPGRSRANPAN